MARRKRTITNVSIVDIADRGMAFGKTPEGQAILVQGVVPGDVVDVLILRKKKGLPSGVVTQFHSYSEHRTEPFCSHFGICGGCKWQSMSYPAQLVFKERTVKNTLERIGKVENLNLLPIAGAPADQYYRNKLEFSFSNKRWLTEEEIKGDEQFDDRKGLGFHCPGAFDKVVDVEHCYLQPEPSNGIRNAIREYADEHNLSYYDIRNHGGLLRNVIVRTNRKGDCMIVFNIYDEDHDAIRKLIDHLIEKFPAISSAYYCVNQKGNDTILDLPLQHVHGDLFLYESLGDVRFQVGPKSFFQTNPVQAETLYDIAKEFAGLQGHETLYDLYCGIGSISLYLAKQAGTVVGIEEVPEAIEDAWINAKLNEIENTHFLAGDVKDLLNDELISKHGHPEVLITDPPRAGMHKDVVAAILRFAPSRIVYVSCNPATQARDLQLLQEKYDVVKAKPVDMFPHTHHIENVALLVKREN